MSSYSSPVIKPISFVLHTSFAHVLQTFSDLCKLMAVRVLIEIVLGGIFLLLFATVGVGSIVSHMSIDTSQGISYISFFGNVNTWIFTIGIAIVGIAYVLVMSFLSAITIATFSKKTNLEIDVLQLCLSRFIPFFLSQVVCLLLIIGGFFAGVLPGIGMMIVFTFVPFVVLFERTTVFHAMQKSITLVTKQPLSLLSRILLLWGMGIVMNGVVSMTTHGIFQIVSLVVCNTVFWWYSQAYLYLLYRQVYTIPARSQTSLSRVFVLSLSGWVLAFCIITSLYSFVISGQAKQMFSQNQGVPTPFSSHNSYSLKEI